MATDGTRAGDPTGSDGGGWRTTMAGVVAIGSLIALIFAIAYLIRSTGADEREWMRTVYALTPIETIAFAAVGWLFGREVYRQQAQKSEERADQVQAELSQTRQEVAHEAQRGATVADVLLNKLQARSSSGADRGGATERVSRAGGVALTQADINELEQLVTRLYPERVQ